MSQIHVVPGTGIEMNAGGITPEMLGIIHGRAAKALGVPNSAITLSHWGGNPRAVEIWKGMAGYGEHLATFYPDLAAEDPCVLPPVEDWTK